MLFVSFRFRSQFYQTADSPLAVTSIEATIRSLETSVAMAEAVNSSRATFQEVTWGGALYIR